MAVGGALLKIGPFTIPYLGNRFDVAESSNPHLDSSEMEATTPAALVEPKEKSKNPAAKAKRMKRLWENPDFIEAVQDLFSVAKTWEDAHDVVDAKCHALLKKYHACLDGMECTVELKNKYIDQLEGNKVLVDAIQGYKELLAVQEETIRTMRATRDAQDVMLELNKQARNPNRVTGHKRGRPQGSKSKAVTFGAEAMPDNDLVAFGTAEEFEAALM
jgi:hypothetical protein